MQVWAVSELKGGLVRAVCTTSRRALSVAEAADRDGCSCAIYELTLNDTQEDDLNDEEEAVTA